MTSIKLCGVSKIYPPGFSALNDISFEVAQGETVGVIGANGAGKSTLLALMLGAAYATRGSVEVCGLVCGLLELGAGFHPDFTGRENIWMAAAVQGASRRDISTAIEGVVAFADIGDFIDRPLRTYSSGMTMRLGFAVATLKRPDVLLVDEALAVGDAQFATKCIRRIKSFRDEGTTIVLVSHDLGAVKNLCVRTLWLDHGRIRADGPSKDVIEAYMDDLRRVTTDPESAKVGHGNGEIQILGVTFRDGSGNERSEFDHGESLSIEVDFFSARPQIRPSCGGEIWRNDNVLMMSWCSKADGASPEVVSGRFKGTFLIRNILLGAGTYSLTLGIYDTEILETRDYHDRLYGFRIASPKRLIRGAYHQDVAYSWHSPSSDPA